jgi:hypothetical protein
MGLMSNFRGISLMTIAAKVYNRVLFLERTKPASEQAEAVYNRSTFLKGLWKAPRHKISRCISRSDFSILHHYGIPNKIVSAIRVLYDNSTSIVYVDGQQSEEFNITTGVLQGDVLAPFLFIIIDMLSISSQS